MKLKNRTGEFPPNGFYFKDARTGMEFKDGDFYSIVRMILAHRQANPRLYVPEEFQYLNFDSISAQLDSYTCERLGGGRFCEDGVPKTLEAEAGAIPVTLPRPCYRCNSMEGYPVQCSTCGGKVIAGYICLSCKAPLGR